MDRKGRPRQDWLVHLAHVLVRYASCPTSRSLSAISIGAASAAIVSAIGAEVLVAPRMARATDVLWAGVTIAISVLIVLAVIAFIAPEDWRTTRSG
jgi:hypothetical protein